MKVFVLGDQELTDLVKNAVQEGIEAAGEIQTFRLSLNFLKQKLRFLNQSKFLNQSRFLNNLGKSLSRRWVRWKPQSPPTAKSS